MRIPCCGISISLCKPIFNVLAGFSSVTRLLMRTGLIFSTLSLLLSLVLGKKLFNKDTFIKENDENRLNRTEISNLVQNLNSFFYFLESESTQNLNISKHWYSFPMLGLCLIIGFVLVLLNIIAFTGIYFQVSTCALGFVEST